MVDERTINPASVGLLIHIKAALSLLQIGFAAALFAGVPAVDGPRSGTEELHRPQQSESCRWAIGGHPPGTAQTLAA